jgi:hypothetical protein
MADGDGWGIGERGDAEGGREIAEGGGAGGIVGADEGVAECAGGRRRAEAAAVLLAEELAAGGMVDGDEEAGGAGGGFDGTRGEEGFAGGVGEEGALLEEGPEALGVVDGFGFEVIGEGTWGEVGSVDEVGRPGHKERLSGFRVAFGEAGV